MTEIPRQLRNSEFNFVLLGKWNMWRNEAGTIIQVNPEHYETTKTQKWVPLGKAPFEKEWQKRGLSYDSDKLLKHIEEGKNFGVIGGYGNLRILDIDDKFLGQILTEQFKTFTIETGSGGRHFYFISPYNENHVLVNELGELRARNYQVVCPPCKHPSGNQYKIVNDVEIREIKADDLKKLIEPYLRKAAKTEDKKDEDKPKDTSGSGLEYRKVVALLRKGTPKKEIFVEMMKYAKWATHGASYPQYRENTYNNAKKFVEKQQVWTGKKEELKKVINRFDGKDDLAKQLYEIQPFFLDEIRNWWLWNWNETKWERVDDVSMLIMVKTISFVNTINSKEKNEILEAMRQEGRQRIPKPIKPTWIQFKNKIFDVETDEQFKATPEYFVTNPINWKIGETEETPVLDNLFKSWVGEEHKKELYEILAFCLVPQYFIHRIICLIGSGANGKSTFLRILKKFIGGSNACAISMDSLMLHRFAAAKLWKKLVCIMGETNFNTLQRTEKIKKLTGEDTIDGEIKNKDPFDFESYAKLVMATNSLPITADKTEGFYRRWKIIDFNNKFKEEKDVFSKIPDKEFENLAKKCLNVVKKLWNERLFTNDGNFEDRRKRYEEKSNPITLFIKQNYDKNINENVVLGDFCEELSNFLLDNGYRALTHKIIAKQMRDEGFEVKKLTIDKVSTFRILGIIKKGEKKTTGSFQKMIFTEKKDSNV